MDSASGAFLAFLHNLSPAEEPVACVSPTPTRTQTPAYLLRPEWPRPPRRIYCPHSRFVALGQHTAKSRPAAQPLASPGREKGKRAGRAAPAPGKDTRAASGVPQLRFYSWQGEEEEEAAAQDGRGSSGLGAGGVEGEHTPRGERGAPGGAGPAGLAGARDSGATRETAAQAAENVRGRGGGQEGRTDGPESWGRRAPQGAGGAGRSARRAGAGETSGQKSRRTRRGAQVRGWGAMDPKGPTWVGVLRAV